MTDQTEETPIIPSMPTATRPKISAAIRCMFNGNGPHPLEAEIRAAITQQLIHVWTVAGGDAKPPSWDEIHGILKRYVEETPPSDNDQKPLAYLHATFNSMHPQYFDAHQTEWSRFRKTHLEQGIPPFGEPLFWIIRDPVAEFEAAQRRAVETLTDPVPPTPAG